jgi:DNA-binding response OmpR family regulator
MNKPQVDLSGSTILTVDDVPTNLDVLSHTLEESGYDVLVAVDGETALKVAASTLPDLILLDVMMPGIDGYETCRRLKADPSLQEIPVIFLTARDDIQGLVEGFAAGGEDYVVKPFEKQEVLVRIRTHLEKAHFARALAELNAHLEEKVKERTRQLHLKVQELEGKDRIAQHLLQFHTLEDTLELVLQVVSEILELGRSALYLEEENRLKVATAVGFFEAGQRLPREQLGNVPITPEHLRVFEQVRRSGRAVHVEQPEEAAECPFAVVPILRDQLLLGVIRVDQLPDAPPVTDATLQTLTSFALQAAVAINDAQVHQDSATWENELDEVLEKTEELEDYELFDDLTGGADD